MKIVCFFIIPLFPCVFYSQSGGEDCSTASAIQSLPFSGIGSTLNAQDDYFTICSDAINLSGAPDHVYSYTTGNTNEIVKLSLCEQITDFDSQLYVYQSSCLNPPIACMEDGCQSDAFGSPFNSRISNLNLEANTTYYFVIDGYNANSSGNYQLNVTIDNSGQELDSTSLPIIVISSAIGIPDEPKIKAHMGIIQNPNGEFNHLTDNYTIYDREIGIETRGSSSQWFPKKGYAIETRDILGNNLNVSLFGMPSENDWILHGPYSDKSLIRNYLAYYYGAKLFPYAPRIQLCELVINGNYQGVYLFTEKIKKDAGRVNIATLDSLDIEGINLSGGYIIKIDKTTGNSNDGWTSNFPSVSSNPNPIDFLYHYPAPDKILSVQQDYIQSFVQSFENALQNQNPGDLNSGYRAFADITSFVNYFILNELTRNVDGYRISTYLYKEKDNSTGKLHIGPPWDYNLAFGNADYCNGSDITGWAKDFNSVCSGDNSQIPFWWDTFLNDSSFTNRLKCKWNEIRLGYLHDDSIAIFITNLANQLTLPAERNFMRWEVLDEYVWPNNYVGGTYQNEINYLKTWILDRISWLDENMPGLATNCELLENEKIASINPTFFPNPFQDKFYLEHQFNKNELVQIIDVFGNIIVQDEVNSNNTVNEFNLSFLAKGIYFVSFPENKALNPIKIIKN